MTKNVQKLKVLIEKAMPEISEYKSSCLAEFLDEQGVAVVSLPVRIGTPIWCVRARIKTASGRAHSCYVIRASHIEYLKKNGAEFYLHQKLFHRNDICKLGKMYFLSKEEAEKKLAECVSK